MIALMVIVIVLIALGLASQLGLSADSRDGADWRPTDAGTRAPANFVER